MFLLAGRFKELSQYLTQHQLVLLCWSSQGDAQGCFLLCWAFCVLSDGAYLLRSTALWSFYWEEMTQWKLISIKLIYFKRY